MAFRFSLQALLRFRQGLEHQQELLLQEANQRVAAARLEIEDLDRGVEELTARDARALDSGVSAAELQFDLLCRAVLLEHRRQLERELAKREELCAQRRQEFQQARRQREVVDTLRQHQLHLYRQQENRQERRRLDDLFLLRREFLRRG